MPESVSHSVMSDSLQAHDYSCQAPLSMAFSRQEYWSGLPFPSPDLPNLGMEHRSPALQADSLPSETRGKNTDGKINSENALFPHHLYGW